MNGYKEKILDNRIKFRKGEGGYEFAEKVKREDRIKKAYLEKIEEGRQRLAEKRRNNKKKKNKSKDRTQRLSKERGIEYER